MPTLTLAISGSGGSGAISTGEMLLRLAARQGYYGMLKKTFSPQIRGGESAAILRLGDKPVANFDGHIDVLLAFDWQNFSRFADQVPVSADTLVMQSDAAGEAPGLANCCAQLLTLDAARLASTVESSWVNLVFLGMMAQVLGSRLEEAEDIVLQRLDAYTESLKSAALRALDAGFCTPPQAALNDRFKNLHAAKSETHRWLASGNQMAALGALEAGIRFVAAYPITPASDLLEWLALHIEQQGGHLVQAEDELAAINMTIGAGFGGVAAMTATSGPGLALMSEAMGLAVASETPVVVLDVMRGGPSTGIPTKSEQSDLNLALYGLHGDAPHIVLACQSITDCHFTSAWAVHLATRLQTLVIVLSDQFLGQSLQVIDAPNGHLPQAVEQNSQQAAGTPYLRYRNTDNGISPMAVPGKEGHMYTADGLEHSQAAVPSPRAVDHQLQMDKRLRKLTDYDFGDDWACLYGDVNNNDLLICWGSVTASALEARANLAAGSGRMVAILSLRLLNPLPQKKLVELLSRAGRVIVVEQNHSGQLYHHLRSQLADFKFESCAKPGPILITPADIAAALESDHVAQGQGL